MSQGPLLSKSYAFALSSVALYKELIDKKEYVLSRQFLRSATSIGANVEEANGGLSKLDFSAKLSIAYKEARETRYWLRLLHDAKFIDDRSFRKSFADGDELVKILFAILKTTGRIRGTQRHE